MKKFGNLVVKNKWLIVIIAAILLVPSILGYFITDTNYDMLVYLPSDIETVKGENILTDDFNMGAFSVVVVENMANKDLIKLEEEFRNIEGVENVISINDLTGTTIPIEMLPSEITAKVATNNSKLVLVTFRDSTSDEDTLKAVEKMRDITEDNVKIGGMSAMVLDTKELVSNEVFTYVALAVVLCILVLELSLDSYIVPILLILNIGIAVLFNMGSNIIFGEISYITKSIAAVLQLGVTTDFSIFLYHKYERLKKTYNDSNKAMSEAIHDTFVSVAGSSLTTIAGFLALCTMKLTLGTDIGLVMAKGVLVGVICVLTVFPAILLVFDNLIEKTKHKVLLPDFKHIKNFVMKNYIPIFIIFLILLLPAYFAQEKTTVYYKLDGSIPADYGYSVAATTLKEDYGMISQEMILVDSKKPNYVINKMVDEIKALDGIDAVIAPTSLANYGITESMIPDDIRKIYETEDYKMIVVLSNYEIATDELNRQIDSVNDIISKYDSKAILAGEGPLMKDLITTTDIDFKNVNFTSIGVIFVLMLIVLKSISLPILLVAAIEFAIFINMGIPYFTGTSLPFIASVVIGTIQLGATIDYAILMTTKYLEERGNGLDKKEAVKSALDNSVSSIFVSAMCFFAATIGVALVSKIDMINSLCTLMSRGALVSMLVVILILPSILLIFDKVIMKTTLIKKNKENKKGKKNMKNLKKVIASSLVLSFLLTPISTLALTKEETVYTKLNSDGSVKTILVNEHLINKTEEETLSDLTDLKDIININSDSKYTLTGNKITWDSFGSDIFYQGTTDKELPISEKITYKLDGKEISLDDLIGKSGSVEITIKYTNNSKNYVNVNGKTETLYTPFVVASLTNISNTNNSNVNVTNGKVVDNGIGYTVVAMSAPGLYESLNIDELKGLDTITITLDTTKFELASIYSVATPKILESSDLDIFNKLNKIYNNIGTLQSSMNQIQEGSQTILDNLTKVSDGSSQISENLNIVLEKLGEIKDGTIALDNGITEIVAGLENSQTEFADIETNLAKMQMLTAKNTETLDKLTNAKETYENFSLDGGVTIIGLANFTEADILSLPINDTKKQQLVGAKRVYEAMSLDNSENIITLLTGNNTALNSSIEAFTTITSTVSKLNDYLPQLKEGADKLSEGTKALRDGVDVLNTKMNELAVGTNSLKDGMNTLNNGISTFNSEGIGAIMNISNQAKMISSKLDALVDLSNDYQSFSLKDNTTESNTKFILVVDGKEAPKEIKKQETTKKKESLWDRIVNLFK